MTPNEKKTLKMAEQYGTISVLNVAKELGVTPLYARDIVRKLIREDYLEKVAPGKYIPTAKKPPLRVGPYII